MKIISDFMWESMKDVFPRKKTKKGRPEFCPRRTFEGILYVLRTGCQWSLLPEQYGKYKTVHAKFMKWARMGIFEKLMAIARKKYRKKVNKKNIWYAFDTLSKKAPFAKFAGKNPTDRAKKGIKQSLLVDRKGAPLFAAVAPANTHDSKLFEPIVKKLKRSKTTRIIAADSAFDVSRLYKFCKEKNIALIASINPRRNSKKHKFYAPYRWIVEQTFGILSWFRGLKICWSKTLEASNAFLQIACFLRLFKMVGIYG